MQSIGGCFHLCSNSSISFFPGETFCRFCTTCRNTASTQLPGQEQGSRYCFREREQAPARLLRTSSSQACPFPALHDDREEAQGPHGAAAPASPALTRRLTTHPLPSTPFESLIAQMSQIHFFPLTGLRSSFQLFLELSSDVPKTPPVF